MTAVYAAHIRYKGLGSRRASASRPRSAGRRDLPINVSHESIDDEHRAAPRGGRQAGRRLRHRLVPLSRRLQPPPRSTAAGGPGRRLRRRSSRGSATTPRPGAASAGSSRSTSRGSRASGGREYFSDTKLRPAHRQVDQDVATERGTSRRGDRRRPDRSRSRPTRVLVFRRGPTPEQFDRSRGGPWPTRRSWSPATASTTARCRTRGATAATPSSSATCVRERGF